MCTKTRTFELSTLSKTSASLCFFCRQFQSFEFESSSLYQVKSPKKSSSSLESFHFHYHTEHSQLLIIKTAAAKVVFPRLVLEHIGVGNRKSKRYRDINLLYHAHYQTKTKTKKASFVQHSQSIVEQYLNAALSLIRPRISIKKALYIALYGSLEDIFSYIADKSPFLFHSSRNSLKILWFTKKKIIF